MNIVILAIGSRGDVQPLVALGRGLKKSGHRVIIATHRPNRKLVESHGLTFLPIRFDFKKFFQKKGAQAFLVPREDTLKSVAGLMRFMKAIEPIADNLWEDCLKACRNADAILSVPILPGVHIAEKKDIPCFHIGFYPLTEAEEFPCPLLPLTYSLGKTFNKMTYRLVEQSAWWVGKKIVNRWRKDISLPPIQDETFFEYLRRKKWPFLYGYSTKVLPRPKSWPNWIHVTGYWFLDTPETWRPPEKLAEFLKNGPPPVYVGFGSMPKQSENELRTITRKTVTALKNTGNRGLLLSGWSDFGKGGLPESVLNIDGAPHDWLFPHMKALIHHGGAGTTAAAIRSGRPMLVIPFLGDQFFWGRRIEKLGIGPPPVTRSQLTVRSLEKAIRTMENDDGMRKKAAAVGKALQKENGVKNAVRIINRYLEKAKNPLLNS